MSDCRLTKAVADALAAGGEIHSETAVRMRDGKVYKIHRDGTREFMWRVSNPDAPKISFHFKDI